MAFARVDMETALEEDFALSIGFTDTVTALDITGASFDLLAFGPAGASIEASTANGLFTIVDATGATTSGAYSLASWNVPAATIGALPPGVYRYTLTLSQLGQTFEVWTGAIVLA